ncbi:FecCD family ABC transporter permease [Rhodospirillum centenum]|uniref:FecCD transport family protein n=1 Tax=Rhodospirillum centenum (strain ATCC 51521 / SW) TaxID=414684 RepID=B6IXQ9_RHOCS|nr:iron ABC transporter permease [Rhodospirillum centenum]ACJ01083.1 FecCD transport family protein [Rhodospirillum centenum SW]
MTAETRPAVSLPWRRWLPAVAVCGAVLLAFAVGQYPVGPGELLASLRARVTGGESGLSPTVETVIWQIRLPRVVAALAVGAALAAAGGAYQSLFRNPLVSPDLLGVSAGASLGAILGIVLAQPLLVIQGLAFAGGLGAVALVYLIGSALRGHDPVLQLVLTGIAVGAMLSAAISLLKVMADPYDQLPAITYWLLGSLAAVGPDDMLALLPACLLGLLPLWLFRWRMNLLTLGEEEAKALGLETRRLRLLFIAGATLMTAASVAVAGLVGWVGLLVPHVARMLVGPDFRRLLPASLLLGAGFLLVLDTLARTVAAVEVPLGILTACLGAPFFLWLMAVGRRGWT